MPLNNFNSFLPILLGSYRNSCRNIFFSERLTIKFKLPLISPYFRFLLESLISFSLIHKYTFKCTFINLNQLISYQQNVI
jgi:hypothetical protein